MIVENKFGAIVCLALVILGGAVVLGFLLTETEVFNPHKAIQQANTSATKSALEAREKIAALEAIETPRAFQYQMSQTETLVAAQATQSHQSLIVQATVVPAQQAATLTAASVALFNAQANATQTAIAAGAQMRAMEVPAKQTEIATQQTVSAQHAAGVATRTAIEIGRANDERDSAKTHELFVTMATVAAIASTGIGVGCYLVWSGRAKEKTAAAILEREKRHTLQTAATVQTKEKRQLTPAATIPSPQQAIPKNGHGEEEALAV